jgi:hypothetical protein
VTQADELMVTSMIHGHRERLRVYEMLAREWSSPNTGARPTHHAVRQATSR